MSSNEPDLNARLHAQIRHAYEHAPAVRRRLQEAGLTPEEIRTVADLSRIPVLPKDRLVDLQQADPPFGGLLAVPLEELHHIFLSPGPIYEPGSPHDPVQVETAQEALRRSGFGPGDVVLNCLSYHLVPAGLHLDHALTEMGCVVVPGGVGNTDLQVKMLVDLPITGYVGTPSFLLTILRRAEENGIDLRNGPIGLRRAFCTAEPLFPAQREALVQRYGLSVGNAYATAELGFLALNTDGGREMRLLPGPVIQVVDPQTGQDMAPGSPGEVVVTNFNRAYPLIRLGTGDMAILVDPNPGQSRQEERSIILVGRSGEAVKVRGMFVHPNQIRFVLAQTIPDARFQGIVTQQEGRDHFRLRIGAGQVPEGAAEAIAQAVRQVCRVRVDAVEFVDPEAIPEDAQGMVDQRDWGGASAETS